MCVCVFEVGWGGGKYVYTHIRTVQKLEYVHILLLKHAQMHIHMRAHTQTVRKDSDGGKLLFT